VQLTFDIKVSSEAGFDYLYTLIDNKAVDAMSGDSGEWVAKTYYLTGKREHALAVCYIKVTTNHSKRVLQGPTKPTWERSWGKTSAVDLNKLSDCMFMPPAGFQDEQGRGPWLPHQRRLHPHPAAPPARQLSRKSSLHI
jgi:hypothetical protein